MLRQRKRTGFDSIGKTAQSNAKIVLCGSNRANDQHHIVGKYCVIFVFKK